MISNIDYSQMGTSSKFLLWSDIFLLSKHLRATPGVPLREGWAPVSVSSPLLKTKSTVGNNLRVKNSQKD